MKILNFGFAYPKKQRHGLLDAISTASWCLVNSIIVPTIEGSDCRINMGSENAWVKKCVPPRIQRFWRHTARGIAS